MIFSFSKFVFHKQVLFLLVLFAPGDVVDQGFFSQKIIFLFLNMIKDFYNFTVNSYTEYILASNH